MNIYLLIFFCIGIIIGYLLYYVPKVELFNLTIPMTFSQKDNYATFERPTNIDLNEFLFQVYFSTFKDSGLILMVQTVTLEYLIVYLEQGFIKVILAPKQTHDSKFDNKVHLQSHSGNLNDGVEHSLEIRVSRFSNEVTLSLNGTQEVSAEAGIHERPLNTVEHMCLGGLSSQVKEAYKGVPPFVPSLYSHLTFKGCLVEPRINSNDLVGKAFLHNTIYGCVPDLES